jgi:P pilus assembly chaperone PapD
VLAVYEFEWIFYVPILVFCSPSQLVEQHQTVTTDSNGRAQFTVRFKNASTYRITLADQILRVVSYQTTDSFRGSRERLHVPSRSDYRIEWGAVGGVSKLSYDTNIVVSTAQPK